MPGKCLLFFKRSCPNYFDDIHEDQLKEMRVVFSIEDPNLFVWEGDFFYPESLIVARKKRAEENPHGQLIGG